MSYDDHPRKYIHDWAKNADGLVPKGAKLSDIVDDGYVSFSPSRQARPATRPSRDKEQRFLPQPRRR